MFFYGDDRLEGVLEWPADGEPGRRGSGNHGLGVAHVEFPARDVRGGVVIAHPHPLYGGTMAQPVVFRLARACNGRGMATLRFNFRGVGRSRGGYDGIREHRDVEAAASYLRGRLAEGSSGHTPAVALAGYSFGSVMAALAAGAGLDGVAALVVVAFVVGWEGFPSETWESLGRFGGPVLAVCGEHDDLAPPRQVEKLLREHGVTAHMEVVAGTDHFFTGRQRDVGEKVAAFLEAAFGQRGGAL